MADTASDSRTRVGVWELRNNLSSILHQASQGASFRVMSHDEVVAEIGPPSPTKRVRRQAGALKGRIHNAPDFDSWPEGMLDAMEE